MAVGTPGPLRAIHKFFYNSVLSKLTEIVPDRQKSQAFTKVNLVTIQTSILNKTYLAVKFLSAVLFFPLKICFI